MLEENPSHGGIVAHSPVDTLVNGNCQHAPRANGTVCQTSLCVVGEACQAGECTGGSARVCNDDNPCTNDSCDQAVGCVSVASNTNVPDDGVACTTDKCTNGFASHTPSHVACDDTLWCTGSELCDPGKPGADAQG